MILYVITIILSYIVGSIPFGYILTHFILRKDIRKEGSGNIGATNVLRVGNKKLALLTLLLDAIKVIVPILILIKFHQNHEMLLYLAGLFAIIGHIFPVWLNFRGGKGVASSFALILFMTPLTGLITLVIWLMVFMMSRLSSLSSILSLVFMPIIVFLQTQKIDLTIFYVMISVIVITQHKDNIKRIVQNKESKIKF